VSESSPNTWILRLQRWVEGDDNIRLALIVGSQARTDVPADPLSDIDVALFARNPQRLLLDEGWITKLGPRWTSHLEENGLRTGEERRVLFDDGQDVDFAVFPAEFLRALTADPQAAAVLRRGFRMLANKDSMELIVPPDVAPPAPPSLSEFSNLVNDYWFHLVWSAKKLRRGELLTALQATNGYLGLLLVRAVRWHAVVRGPSGRDLWHSARFFERWADPRIVKGFPATVAQYDATSVAQALQASRAMFSWLTEEVREGLSFPRPLQDERALSDYIDRLLDPIYSRLR
jgi:aminoglycoside 6-adenylyltransferase